MRSPVRSLTGALIACGLIAACTVDRTGLGGRVSGVAGSTAVGVAGRGGTAGVAGASGGGGGGAGIGVAGTGGPGGGPGGAGSGDAGTGGTTAVGGGGGTSDVAGQGGGGAAGTGTAGVGGGGAGGTMDATCGPTSCPDCFRCGTQGSCEPTPSARWTVICQSAVIAPTKPNGSTWDAPPPATSGAAPDTVCELTIDGDDTGETAVVNDSLTPMWNQSVNPSGGENVTASLLMSAQNRWRIAIIDRDIQPIGSTETVCQTLPRLTADDFHRGMVSLTAGSCTQINLGLACDDN